MSVIKHFLMWNIVIHFVFFLLLLNVLPSLKFVVRKAITFCLLLVNTVCEHNFHKTPRPELFAMANKCLVLEKNCLSPSI